jgi:FkbM family methyltransferase
MKRAASHYHGSAGTRYSEYQRRIVKLGGRLNRVTERRLVSHFLKPVVHVKTTRLGSEYGAVHVPVQLLTDKSIVYSAGVGEDVTFDLGLIETVGCEVWAFDPTPRSIEFARSIREPRFHFLPLGVWSEDSVQRFHTPADSVHVSHSIANLQQTTEYFDAECRSVRSLMTELGHGEIDLLKLNIEGAEYEVLASLGDVRPRILCVEFHKVQTLRRLVRFIGSLPYEPIRVDGFDVTLISRESWPEATGPPKSTHGSHRSRGTR